MKIANSLKSLKKRDKNCRIVRRKGRVYVINKVNPRYQGPPGLSRRRAKPRPRARFLLGSGARRRDRPCACRRPMPPRSRAAPRSPPISRAIAPRGRRDRGRGRAPRLRDRRAHRLSPEPARRCAALDHGGGRASPALLPRAARQGGAARRRHVALGRRAAARRRHRSSAMGKFNRILEIDYDNRCAVVQPGVTNLAHHERGRSMQASTTRPIRRARSPARSAATSPRIRAACIASNTGSPPTTCWASSWC